MKYIVLEISRSLSHNRNRTILTMLVFVKTHTPVPNLPDDNECYGNNGIIPLYAAAAIVSRESS